MYTSEECRVKILEYLRSYPKKGPIFVRARWIARDVGLSSKQVGSNMRMLTQMDTEFKIEHYTGSSGCIWKVDVIK